MLSVAAGGKAAERARSGKDPARFAVAKIASTWSRGARERLCSRSAATVLPRTPHSGRSGSRDWSNGYSLARRGGGEPRTAPGRVWDGRTPVGAGETPHRGPRTAPGRPQSAVAAPIVLWAPRTLPGTATRPLAALWRVLPAAVRPCPTHGPANGSDAAPVTHDGCGRAHDPFSRIRARRRGDGRHSARCGGRKTRSRHRSAGSRGKMAVARWSRALRRWVTGRATRRTPRPFSSSISLRTVGHVETVAGSASDRTGQWPVASC